MSYFSPTEVMKSEKNRHYELGKYMAAIQGTLPSEIKKKLCINHHIAGLYGIGDALLSLVLLINQKAEEICMSRVQSTSKRHALDIHIFLSSKTYKRTKRRVAIRKSKA